MVVQGRLLVDPSRTPEPGWIRVEGGRISEVGFGDLPRGLGPPTLGGAGRIISPAFIDAHMHVPQIDSVGCDGMPLLEWLERVVFPAEAWWGRGAAGRDVRTTVRRLAEQGTVGAAVYLTSDGEASAEALGLLARTPMRWIAGRVAMDRGGPEGLTAEDRRRAAMRPVPSVVAAAPSLAGRVVVSANPRFAISCSDELLAEVGWAVKERAGDGGGLFVQTHLSESREEVAEVRRLFPGDDSYARVYDRFGLLGPRTLLAHCVHLSAEEWRLIAERGCVVVHCPTANIFLKAGLFNWDAALEHSARVALGSDIAGGPDVAMPRVARAFIETAKVRALTGESARTVRIPTPAEAWNLITRGNADALGWRDGGRLEVGAAADLLVLRTPETWLDEHIVGRLIYNWSAELIESRVFAGRVADPARMFDGPVSASAISGGSI
jgi:guanine deaminase